MVDSRLTYSRWPAKGDADDSHHIHSVASSNGGLGLNPFLLRFLLLGYAFLYLFILLKDQGISILTVFWSFLLLLGGLVLKMLLSNNVEKGETGRSLVDDPSSHLLFNVTTNNLVVTLFPPNKPNLSESVLLMPAFGVQLQTHYLGGKVIRRFIPVDKILKPVLVEHVTPLTCYWSLCLLMREEAELTPVFKGLRPPVKMLVPIWEALCAAANSDKEKSWLSTQDAQHR